MLTYTTNAKQFTKDFDRRLRQAMYEALHDTAVRMKQEMQKETSGGISTLQLRRMGHPFARRHKWGKSNPIPVPLTPINRQTGGLQNSYYDYFSRIGGMEFMWTFGFAIPYASYVLAEGGTRYMVDRKYWVSLERVIKPILFKNVEDNIKLYFG